MAQADGPSGEVHGGPRGQPARQRLAGARIASTSPRSRSTRTGASSRSATTSIDDYGAYFIFAVAGNTNAMAQTTGPYAIGSCETAVRAVLTNKNQQGVFRGAGSDVGNWVLERLVDAAAAGARDRRRSSCAGATCSSPTSSRTRSRPGTSTTRATTRRCSTRRSRTPSSSSGAPSRRAGAGRGATSASAWRPRSSARPTPRPSSGSTTRAPTSACRRRPRACASGSARPAG